MSLSALSPRRAAARIFETSHNNAVDFFAVASSDNASEILKELLRTDESRVIAILADLSRRRANQLIQPLMHEFSWLADIPKVAEEITNKAEELELREGQEHARLQRVTRETGSSHGYFRIYDEGVVYWSDSNVCVVNGRIAGYYAKMGGPSGRLGLPLGQGSTLAEPPGRIKGVDQRFEGGNVYSSALGTFIISTQFSEAYLSVDGPTGWLGFPTSDVKQYENDSTIQHFEGGDIFASQYGTFPVRKEVGKAARGLIPISREAETKRSPVTKGAGTRQLFWASGRKVAAVYTSESGAYRVAWRILSYYQTKGGLRRWVIYSGTVEASRVPPDSLPKLKEMGHVYGPRSGRPP